MSNHRAYGDFGPSRSTSHRARLCRGDIAMWFGTMSATRPRPCSRAVRASARSPLLAAQFLAHARVVHDVVAVRRARHGLQHRGQVQVRDAEQARYGTAAAAPKRDSGCNCSRYVARGATGAVEAVGIAGTAGSGRSGVAETYVPASPPFVSSAPPRAYARVA